MSKNIVESLAIELGLDAQEMEEGLKQVETALNQFEAGLRNLGKPIEEIAKNFTAGGLLMGRVSDEVASEIERTGTRSQKAALLIGRGLDALQDKTRALGEGFKKLGTNILNAFKPSELIENFSGKLLKMGAPLGALFGIEKLFSTYLNQGEKLLSLSDRVGESVTKLDAWGKATRDAGGSAEAFFSTIENWTAQGRSAESFFNIAKQLEGLNNRQALQALNAHGISREAGAALLKYKGSIDSVIDSYKTLALTKKQAEEAKAFNLEWDRLKDTIQAGANVIAAAAVPVLRLFTNVLSSSLGFLVKHAQFVKIVFTSLAALIGIKYVMGVMSSVQAMGGLIGILKTATVAARTFSAALMANPLGLVIAAVIALGVVLDDLFTFVDGGNSLIEEFLEWLGATPETIETIRSTLKAFFDFVGDLPGVMLERFKNTFKIIYNLFAKLFKGDLVGVVEEGFNLLDNALLGLPRKFLEYVSTPIEAMINKLSNLWSGFKDKVSGFFEGAANFFGFGGDEGEAKPAQQVPAAAQTMAAQVATMAVTTANNSTANTVTIKNETTINTTSDPDDIAAAVDSVNKRTYAAGRNIFANANSGVLTKG